MYRPASRATKVCACKMSIFVGGNDYYVYISMMLKVCTYPPYGVELSQRLLRFILRFRKLSEVIASPVVATRPVYKHQIPSADFGRGFPRQSSDRTSSLMPDGLDTTKLWDILCPIICATSWSLLPEALANTNTTSLLIESSCGGKETKAPKKP